MGILTGKGYRECSLDFVPKEEDIKEGDLIVTSGLGKSFPEGMKIGEVTKVDKKVDGLSMKVKVRPLAEVFEVEEVIVLKKKP